MAEIFTLQARALDGCRTQRERGATMTRTPLILTLAAAAALAGCNNDDHTIVAGPKREASTTIIADVQLPPSIAASKIYRCKDNSVIYVDWLSDNKSANVRTEKNGAPTSIDTSAEGAILKGSATGPITYKGKSCKA
jgi:hypothetical protein